MLDFFVLTSTWEYPDRPQAAVLEADIALVAQGDRQALCDLYERTRRAAYGFALSILKNAQDAEDVLQETYIRLYAAADRYQPQGKPMAWILTIVRNLARMKLREGARRAALAPEDWERLPASQSGLTSEDRLVLSAALRDLTDEDLRIVMLHAVSGLKHRETAALLQLPLSTVLSKYHRALKKLKIQLTEDGRHAQ